jgi:hypothetical protein
MKRVLKITAVKKKRIGKIRPLRLSEHGAKSEAKGK